MGAPVQLVESRAAHRLSCARQPGDGARSPHALSLGGAGRDRNPGRRGVQPVLTHPWLDGKPPVRRREPGASGLDERALVYCFEGVDNPGIDLRAATVLPEQPIRGDFRPDWLSGVTAIQVEAVVTAMEAHWHTGLYHPDRSNRRNIRSEKPEVSLRPTAIPYYTWTNRAPGPMQVWIARRQLA
ncbi:MAG TPA: hypothetical protein VJ436_07135 [Anaerolineales bacterium]|nr:hypothetical protein [Anaerolineales bacterium]